MAKSLIILFSFLFFLSNSALSEFDEFIFNGFRHAAGDNLTLNGVADIRNNGILELTNDTSRLIGRAFYRTPIKFKNSTFGNAFSFSTAFAFAIGPENEKLGGHGLAFTISPTKDPPGALPSQFMGLLNTTDNGNFSNHIIAVEFDTVKDFEFGDINDNHVGIDINSMKSNASVTAGYFVDGNPEKQSLNLKSGKTIQAWIDYDSAKTELNVTISVSSAKPKTSILSFRVDLSRYLKQYMYVGFSASTGLLASSHYIFGWSFKLNGETKSLDLSSLPSLPRPGKSLMTLIITTVSVSVTVLLIFAFGVSLYLFRRIKNADLVENWELEIGPHRFSYTELKKATQNFREEELLGFGGFGRVYKGTLPNSGTQIAVKRISHESKQGLKEFMSEIASIGRLRHRNLVQLLGWCRRRDDLLLVYDFMPNGSLDKYIFDEPEIVLSWEQRFKIIKGVASGLLYLHEEWEQTVIHRDVKAGNVLLDSDFNGRLGDFGLSKLYDHGANPGTTRVVGTLGYLAPELTRTGKSTTSSDVYAFGALLLEVVCGRRPIEVKALPEELILVDWVWEKWKEGGVVEVVDPRLRGEYDESEVLMVVKLGLLCSGDGASARPSMRQVARYLQGEVIFSEKLKESGGDGGGGRGVEFEEFVHSYTSSSYFDKVSVSSSGDDDGGDIGIEGEAGSATYFSVSQ